MQRVMFKLSMPNVGSWNGQWSGASKNYYRVFKWAEKKTENFFNGENRKSWFYNFGDGWGVNVIATIVPVRERLPKSDGFCGYDWMIDSILKRDYISCED